MSEQKEATQEKEPIKPPYIDYDLENLIVIVGNYKFHINPEGHLPKVSDGILKIVRTFEDYLMTDPMAGKRIESDRIATKKILELGLVELDYLDAIEKLGYGILKKLSDFLFVYHVEHGGKEGFQLWLTTLNLAMRAQFVGTKDSKT